MTDVPVLDISGINTPSWTQALQRSTRVKQHDAAPPPPTHYLTYCSVPAVRPKVADLAIATESTLYTGACLSGAYLTPPDHRHNATSCTCLHACACMGTLHEPLTGR